MKHKSDIGVSRRAVEEVDRLCFEYDMGISNMLQQKAGIRHCVYYQWLHGDAAPSAYTLQKLHRAGADILYIITGERRTKRNAKL